MYGGEALMLEDLPKELQFLYRGFFPSYPREDDQFIGGEKSLVDPYYPGYAPWQRGR